MSRSYDLAALKKDLAHLCRLPTGDRLSLNQFYAEAQVVIRNARAANLDVPRVVTRWLADADARAKDPLLAASQNAELFQWIRTENGSE
jgi:hypothetical protein